MDRFMEFLESSDPDVLEILRLGIIGLAFILALLAYRLLRAEQARPDVRRPMLFASLGFMCFSVILCALLIIEKLYYTPIPVVTWDAVVRGDRRSPMYVCKANGQEIGPVLDCRQHRNCSNRAAKLRQCAAENYPEAIQRMLAKR